MGFNVLMHLTALICETDKEKKTYFYNFNHYCLEIDEDNDFFEKFINLVLGNNNYHTYRNLITIIGTYLE